MPITTIPPPVQVKATNKKVVLRIRASLNATGGAPATPPPTTGQLFPRGTKPGT